MHGLLQSLGRFFFSLGGPGLLLLGILDSSILFMPLGNDLLIIALTSRHPQRMPYYVLMATIGSTIGVAITWWISAKSSQKTLENNSRNRTVIYIERQIKEKGGFALAFAALMPPPFPFTAFVVAAAALQYPRNKMLRIIGLSRLVRFGIDASLAVVYGRQILDMAKSPNVQAFVTGLVVISLAGSAWSVFSWIRKSRNQGTPKRPPSTM